MALTDKLRNLDKKILPGTRGDEEDAESYLRRVAASRAISPAQAGDVMAALRQYFGVEEGAAAAGGEEQTDESDESTADEDDSTQSDETSGDETSDDDKSDDDKSDDES